MWTSLLHVLARIRAFFNVSVLDRELDQELESHMVMLTDENIRRGMAPEEHAVRRILAWARANPPRNCTGKFAAFRSWTP